MADYTQIIDGIHGGLSSGHVVDEHGYIIIDPKTRQITLPVDFNSTIAYSGDINSQIVRFICPETYDGHSLKDCSNHEIRWYNTGSGIGDVSELEVGDNIEGGFILSWLIPPEATTKAGTLQCVISIYDTENNEVIKYQWNTALFTSLLIGATLDNIDVQTITKDKILTLNTKTRNITLPADYNTTIATQGDVGTTFVYIQCPRYIAGMDLTSNKIKKYLGWSTGETSGINECTVEKIYSEVEKDDLVMLIWDVDENLTANYVGNFAFELSFKQFKEDGTTLEKQWYSNSINSLSIKETLGIDGDTIPTSGDTGVFVEAVAMVNETELDKMLKDVLGG